MLIKTKKVEKSLKNLFDTFGLDPFIIEMNNENHN